MKKFVWLSIVTLALIIGQPAVACSTEKCQSKHCHCDKHAKLSNHLNLTKEQKVKIKAIRIQARNNLKANYQQLKALRLQINALAQAEKVDEVKLDNLINQRNQVNGIMQKSHVLMQNQIYNLLTAQQKQKYIEFKKQQEKARS